MQCPRHSGPFTSSSPMTTSDTLPFAFYFMVSTIFNWDWAGLRMMYSITVYVWWDFLYLNLLADLSQMGALLSEILILNNV